MLALSSIVAFALMAYADQQATVTSERCGVYALQMASEVLQSEDQAAEIARRLPMRDEQFSLLELKVAATSVGFETASVRWRGTPSLDGAPAILPIVLKDGRRHFVTAVATAQGQMLIVDYPTLTEWIDEKTFRDEFQWDGSALHVCKTKEAAIWTRLMAVRASGGYVAAAVGAAVFLVTCKFRIARRRGLLSAR